MADALRVIPAVSLRGGDVVVVNNHSYEPVEDAQGRAFALDEFAQVFLKEFDAVLVFDIDGIEGGRPQFDEAARLEGSPLEVWWDGGVRDHDDVIGILTSGVHKALVSTRSLAAAGEISKAVELSDSVVFEAVVREGRVVASSPDFRGATVARAASLAAAEGAEEVLVLDASRPLGAPIDWAPLAGLPGSLRALYIGGGIDLETARRVKAPAGLPYRGAVVDLISVLTPYV